MAKLKGTTKADFIKQLCEITQIKAEKLTVKQLKLLIAKHA
jgi:hypothetical protein